MADHRVRVAVMANGWCLSVEYIGRGSVVLLGPLPLGR